MRQVKQELSPRERRVFIELPAIRAVLTLALPTILGQLITVIYNFADTYFVGRPKDPAMVAAIAICMPLMLIMTGMANLFGVGGSSLIARCLGRQEFQKARQTSAFCVWACGAVAVGYALALFLLQDTVLGLLGADGTTLEYCRSYLFWVCVVGGLPTILSSLLAHLVRSEGAAKEASFGLSLGAVLNIGLDPLFMFVLLPPGREVAGAAVATMLSNLAAALYYIVYIVRRRKNSVLSLDPRDVSVGAHIPGDVLSIGLPSFLMTILSSVSNATVNNLISSASSTAVAGMGIGKKVNMISFRVSTGITQGSLPLIAYNHAAGDYRRMRQSILSAADIAVGFALVCMCAALLFGGQFVRFFIDDPATVEYGRQFVRIVCVAMPLASASMTVMMLFQAAARKAQATVLSILRKGVLDIPLMFVLNEVWPVYGVACATPIAEVISCVLAVVLAVRFLKSLGGGDAAKF